ncbi:hypothetical protein EVAR_55132_1 [Eumeta japonica]|uniref:Uncharacterized protein n=1 Tax=Eumeta variegata TaxID=151549 RepID=A0A4C1YBN8_EUMVA|nr:hypothetical protein EVAR_55132_1 [Eumeta japonica]
MLPPRAFHEQCRCSCTHLDRCIIRYPHLELILYRIHDTPLSGHTPFDMVGSVLCKVKGDGLDCAIVNESRERSYLLVLTVEAATKGQQANSYSERKPSCRSPRCHHIGDDSLHRPPDPYYTSEEPQRLKAQASKSEMKDCVNVGFI